ncbi:DUF2202 domain-containing protein [Acidihalobacter ferrooxydans]|uniref:DUF2202 domain-containing protein n=1 Tax=Acidihalobacter ferrooxydans TaxID=1765967 RepID=A0A1P8UIA0_9GAMM|nr:DUF2202 domain-containing protein [Acidihalobacter ferrooxydans]APZ43558.1 hypothetical protein BW247_11045 [Acidihalobacter ferrooxydans]
MNRRDFIRRGIVFATITATGAGFALRGAAAATLGHEATDELRFMRQEEKLARDIYQQAYARWHLPVFANVAQAEQRHMDAIWRMLARYGIADSLRDPQAQGGFTDPRLAKLYSELQVRIERSADEALLAAGLIEEVDILDLRKAAKTAPDQSLRRVYANLERGSRNHLRSFASAWMQRTGKHYVAQAMPQAQVDDILASPLERGGNGMGMGH